ncbi:hypothetical protein WMF38_56945 [Sorangium sp. So ce118]
MSLDDIISAALSLGVAVLAGFAFVATLYFGGLAVYETLRDGWRWLKAYANVRRREREEMLQEAARELVR